MRDVEEALTQFAAGQMNEGELHTLVSRAVRESSRVEVASIIERASNTASLQDICLRLLGEAMLASPQSSEPEKSVAYEGMVVRDRFILDREIGRGGMGVVYRARDLRRVEADDRHSEVAIKVMNQALQHHPDALITLQREARRAQQLAHPNIATVFDFDREGDIAYLCMELLDGRPLDAVLKNDAARTVEFSLSMISGICAGLAYAHKSGIVHADLKPGNIFLTRDNVVKILDLGLARTIRASDESAATETVFDAGRWQAMTPAYASLEMFERQEPDPRDDIYGLACVSYELLCGDHPYSRLTATQAIEKGLTVKPIRGLTRRQNRALRKALAFRREDRTATVEAFLDGLMKPRSAARTLAVSAIAAAAILAPIGIAWFYVNQDAAYPDALEDTLNANDATLEGPVAAPEVAESDPSNVADARQAGQPAGNLTLADDVETLSSETQESIERILEIADLHLALGRLVQPSGSNAAEAYLAVAALDSSNQRAKRGLARVMDNVVSEARVLAENGEKRLAIELLEDALDQLPDSPELQAVQRELAPD